ncbi:MAG: radical SAM protein [Candidatus Omnitrophota bacterium]|nr:radical SAM protein [Candidatus Omnitrophota bacterium]
MEYLKELLGTKKCFDRKILEFSCFGITDDCILKCKMCHKWKEDIFIKKKAKIPSLKDWKNCVSSIRGITDDSFQINFGGGEPFLNKDILELVRFCKSKNFKTNIATNGYLIDQEMAKKIADSGLDSVILSLDSLDENTHDYLRGVKGVFSRVMDGMAHLDKYCNGIYKGICCAIYEKNLDGILNLMEWVDNDSRINSIYFMACMQPNNTLVDPGWHKKDEFNFLWPKDSKKISGVIDKLIEHKKNNSKITNQICQLEAFKLYYRCPEKFVKNTKCNMDRAVHISSCGDIFLCYRWPLLGNIQTDDLAEVLGSEKAGRIKQDIAGCKDNCHFLLNCFFKDEYPFESETKK